MDFIIPEAQDPVSALLQKHGALLVRLVSLRMLTAIELDHELRLDAAKIDEVRPDGFLPAKLCASYLPRPEMIPKAVLDVGGLAPQTPCARDARRAVFRHRPLLGSVLVARQDEMR